MSTIIIKIGIAIANFIYLFIKLFPIQKNKITFISRQSNEPSRDFNMVIEELEKSDDNYKIVLLCKRLEKRTYKSNKILPSYN